MNCLDDADLEMLAARELDHGSAGRAEAHLSSCGACRARLGQVEENLRMLAPVRRALGSSDPPGLRLDAAPLPRPDAIAGFAIRGELGRGGMGVVYDAEQEHPRRDVALKILNPAYASDQRHERLFQREVSALARLRHPNLAAVYGAGRTGDGRPYFAMERVSGRGLRKYLEEERPGLRRKLALFGEICGAVAYAHGRGVIHRDLKPSNIMVDADGRVRVLDFGLARVVAEDLGCEAASLSGDGRVQGTVPYMSPEQVRGESQELDARSDVYSLGVVLYEMLAGRLPYPVSPNNLLESARTICEQAPAPLRGVDAALRGDIEAIVFKALEKEPGRRYASAAALAEDIQRHLAGEPVTARAPTFTYIVGRLVRRHRLAAGLSAALVLVVVGFGVWMAVMYARSEALRLAAAEAATKAGREAARATAVSGFLERMLQNASPLAAVEGDPTLREVLTNAKQELDGGSLLDQPEVEATLRMLIGEAFMALHRFDDATVEFERAMSLREPDAEVNPAGLAQAVNAVGMVRFMQGRVDEAAGLFQRAYDMRARVLGASHPDALECYSHLALCREAAGDTDAAVAMQREALAGYEAARGHDHEDVARLSSQLATTLFKLERYGEAEPLQREALAIYQRILPADHLSIAQEMADLARMIQKGRGVDDEARGLAREAIEMQRRKLGDDNASVARAVSALGTMLQDGADYAGAIACYRDALRIYEKIDPDGGASAASMLHNLAWAHRHLQRYDEAAEFAARCLEIRRKRFGDSHPAVGDALNLMAVLAGDRGQHAEAERLHREALELRRLARDGRTMEVASSLVNLGATLHALRRYDEAIAAREEALAVAIPLVGESHPSVASMFQGLADTYRVKGDLEAAEEFAGKALAIRREKLGPGHPYTIASVQSVGQILLAKGDLAGALEMLGEVVESQRATFGPAHASTGSALQALGSALTKAGELEDGEARLREALEIQLAALDADHVAVQQTRMALGRCLTRQERYEEAEPFLLAAVEVLEAASGGSLQRVVCEVMVEHYEGRGDEGKAGEWRGRLAGAGE